MKQLLYFTASWCGPCLRFGPIVEQVAGGIIKKIDMDQAGALAKQYGIRSVPTIILMENGLEVKRHSGLMTAQEVTNFIS